MQHFTQKHKWFLYNLVAVLTVLGLLVPAQVFARQDGDAPACKITGILFDKRQYKIGDEMTIVVRVADSHGSPLPGATVRADVTKEAVQAAVAEGFGLVDHIGEYEGSYADTNVTGQYIFNITVSDADGEDFSPCSASEAILVGDITQPGNPTNTPTATPTNTPITNYPTNTPTATPTNTPITDDPTNTPTATPTNTPITDDPTNTPTVTPTATNTPIIPSGEKVLGFEPSTINIDSCTAQESMVLSIDGMTNLVGVELEIAYDTTVVRVADAKSTVDGIQVRNDGAFAVSTGGFEVQNKVNTTDGLISFAATLLGKQISGKADIITIDWLPQNHGTSQIHINHFALSDPNGQPINAELLNGQVNVSVDCVAAVSGAVALEGRNDYSGVTVIGSTGDQVETGADGQFTVNGGEPVLVKMTGYLSARAEVGTAAQIAGGDVSATNVGNITLLAGDINSDDIINILDLAYIASNYQTVDDLADMNGDGEVNIFDLSLAAGNYNVSGPLASWK